MSGILIIDKPLNITSMDVIRRLRKITGIKKIGHAGTLDPLATGVLVVALSKKYTKRINEIMSTKKRYETEINLSAFSETDDAEGKKDYIVVNKKPTINEVKNVLKKFIGEIDQVPPIYSAIKINGKKAYDLARKGELIKMKKRKVFIEDIKLISYDYPSLRIKVKCGKGTYIRSLGRDIGKSLNTGGYLTFLRRTKVGKFSIENSVKLDDLNENNYEKFLLKMS